MVVAEVPLWVVHSNSQGGAAAALLAGTHTEERAQQSLSLWQGGQKCAIYSLDVHRNLLATAGGDGTVRLWNTQALFAPKRVGGSYSEEGAYVSTSGEESSETNNQGFSSSGEANDNSQNDTGEVHDLNSVVRRKKDGSPPRRKVPVADSSAERQSSKGEASPQSPGKSHRHKHHHRLICTLSAHTGSSVLAVRFSPSGKYLASAGDDAVVCIYAPAANDQWSRIRLCRGHTLDVVDLAWAPDDSHLVSCSLDSEAPIIVWKLSDVANQHQKPSIIGNPYKVLGKDVHTSTVKGVAFDPAGSYLASSGDDPAICIWRAHDDWGLETRIDASSGIFRTWHSNNNDDVQALSNQSMFRRLSWSTDGAFLCATNAVVKNKHVASTISREGWTVSGGGGGDVAVGAAHLVGHKQPVVVSRHATELLYRHKKSHSDNEEEDDDDDEPETATLLALGDRRGFVTVWSTRKSRPLFKLQCSESRCTVTDLAWGRVMDKDGKNKGDMMLLVSLLDGQIVALKFAVPDEIGPFLSARDHARVFQLRYGIDMDDDQGLLVGQRAGKNRLIENTLQMSLEELNDDDEAGNDVFDDGNDDMNISNSLPPMNELTGRSIKQQQEESRSQGKKRVRPVLMSVDAPTDKRAKEQPSSEQKKKDAPSDPIQAALDAAERTAAATQLGTGSKRDQGESVRDKPSAERREKGPPEKQTQPPAPHRLAAPITTTPVKIPCDTGRIESVDLPMPTHHVVDPLEPELTVFTAECTNLHKVPTGSQGTPIPCIDLAIKKNNRVTWRDQLPGTQCSAIAASPLILAVGTTDGSVQLYGNSGASMGWTLGIGFRSHPPLIFGSAIVRLRLEQRDGSLELLAATADGAFGVYAILPVLSLQYKGSVLPAMTHMALGASISGSTALPKLSRLQITDSGRLLLLLSSTVDSSNGRSLGGNTKPQSGVGGSLQAFVYDRPSELWLNVSDSRFVLSDFYSALPTPRKSVRGPLSQLEDAVKIGSLRSPLESSHRRPYGSHDIYASAEEHSGNYLSSRAHCEDRMACALALGSSAEFKQWFVRYVRTLAVAGNASQLRMLVDMLLGPADGAEDESSSSPLCWWLTSSPELLQLDRKGLVRSVVSEMSKNRSLQRVTNEISLEIENM